ncbi:MAG: 50S ribosomal protein L10 [Oscillospiraceae bacterium]|jgi:large subunit ribosomal protein L10|nr:50S ribosomal protein L10 [Oscillospiraceae bacterium]
MPSANVLERKKQVVAELAQTLSGSVAGVLVDYRGITVEDDTKLRRELRAADVKYNVVKNTLLRRATAKAGLTELDAHLTGTTALAVSPADHTAAARILHNFAEKHKTFAIKGGFLEGKAINVDTVESLAKLPGRDVLLATVCNAFQAPIAAFARVIQAVVDKGETAETAAPAEEAAAAEPEVTAEAPTEETATAEVATEAPAEEAPAADEIPAEAPAETAETEEA